MPRGKLIKLLKPQFLHLRTGNNHTGLSRSHPRMVEGNQMRFFKSIHWQRALHKRQVFLLLSVGLPLLPTDQSGPVRPALAAPASPTASPSFPSFSFCASEMLGLSTSPVHFRVWILAPSSPSGGCGLQLLGGRRCPAPPALCTLLWHGHRSRESPNKSAGLKSDSSGSGQSSRAREGGAVLGLKLGCIGGGGLKGDTKEGR